MSHRALYRLCRTVLVLGLAAVCVPVAAAANLAPDAHGVIHACYGSYDGQELHIVGVSQPCRAGDPRLSWNILGRQGPPGHNGVATSAPSLFSLSLSWSSTGGKGGNGGTGGKGGAGGPGGTGGAGGPGGTGAAGGKGKGSVSQWIGDAASTLGDALLLFGLAALAFAIALVPLGWLVARLPTRHRWMGNALLRPLGPSLRIVPFDDSALETKLGVSFAQLAQARVGGGREDGLHLYLVTGEQPAGTALAQLQGVPQTQALAAAVALLTAVWRRQRVIVDGALMPGDGGGATAVALSLHRETKLVDATEFWPSDPPREPMTPTDSNSVLAVAAAGWIEHHAVDQTPGPRAGEVFLSRDPRSWALFRMGSELSRISFLKEAGDRYEQALAIDRRNIGALVDLAHLRRLEGVFDGARTLAVRAVELIEERSRIYQRPTVQDRIWFRAQIVLATIEAEWAKQLETEAAALAAAEAESKGDKAQVYRQAAYERAVKTVFEAMETRDTLVQIFGGIEQAQDAARGAPIGFWARRRIRRRARRLGWRISP